jgi:hypothetical protein
VFITHFDDQYFLKDIRASSLFQSFRGGGKNRSKAGDMFRDRRSDRVLGHGTK